MECFDSRGNFPVKVVHLQRWSSLTSRSGPVQPKLAFPFPRIILSSPFLLRRNQKFGRNANGSLLFDWKHYFSRIMSFHFFLIISLVFDWFDMESSHQLGYISSTYRIYSINRPGRLLNFWTLRVGAYSRLGAY